MIEALAPGHSGGRDVFIPYQSDVAMRRLPIGNFILIGVTVVISWLVLQLVETREGLDPFLLNGFAMPGLVGHMFAHAGIIHLAGNMMFLWIFGNAVCSKVGNGWYIPVYLGLGLVAATTHVMFDGGLAIGASGAVNGIVGMFLVWYPLNNVSMFYWVFFRLGTFRVSSMWVIALWFVFDIWGALRGSGGVAYWAHVGGFMAGFLLALWLLMSGKVHMTRTEKSLPQMFGWEPKAEPVPAPAARNAEIDAYNSPTTPRG